MRQIDPVGWSQASYVYRDQCYGSLSEIARRITGTNWSGPRFFGLTRRAKGGEVVR